MAKSAKIANAFHEVFHDKPSTVDRTKSAEGQRKQMVAIALSKARAAGAKIPRKGGNDDLAADSMKYQYALGRRDNLAAKAAFRAGSVAREAR